MPKLLEMAPKKALQPRLELDNKKASIAEVVDFPWVPAMQRLFEKRVISPSNSDLLSSLKFNVLKVVKNRFVSGIAGV